MLALSLQTSFDVEKEQLAGGLSIAGIGPFVCGKPISSSRTADRVCVDMASSSSRSAMWSCIFIIPIICCLVQGQRALDALMCVPALPQMRTIACCFVLFPFGTNAS